jgi:histidinol phosphatase-like PHP family hydrolase
LNYLNKDYFIIASFHTKYEDKEKWYNSLIKAVRNENVNVIGHLAPDPGITLEKKEIDNLAEEILSNNKIIEVNAKYKRPPIEFIKSFKKQGIRFHLGSDAHSLDEIANFNGIKNLINFIEHSEE